MRICEVVLAPAVGGAETLALELAADLRGRGHLVDVTALDPASLSTPKAIQSGLPTTAHPFWARGKKLRRLSGARRLVAGGRLAVDPAHRSLPNLYVRL